MDVGEDRGLTWEKAGREGVWKRSWKESQGQSNIVMKLWLACILNNTSQLPIKLRSWQRMDLDANSAFMCCGENTKRTQPIFLAEVINSDELVLTSPNQNYPLLKVSFLIHAMFVLSL